MQLLGNRGGGGTERVQGTERSCRRNQQFRVCAPATLLADSDANLRRKELYDYLPVAYGPPRQNGEIVNAVK